MSEFIGYFWDLIVRLNKFVFSECQIVSGVYLGYVLICIFLMGVIMRSILNVAKASSSYSFNASEIRQYRRKNNG